MPGCKRSTAVRILTAAAVVLILSVHSIYSAEKKIENKIKLSDKAAAMIDDPVVVAASKPGENRWGYFQFPTLSALPGGKILYTFSDQADAVSGYGNPVPGYISADNGKTWKKNTDSSVKTIAPHGVISEIFNGEYLCVYPTPALDAKKQGIRMPKPVAQMKSYCLHNFFRLSEISKEFQKRQTCLPARRWTPKEKKWTETTVGYDPNGQLVLARAEGSDKDLLPRTWFEDQVLRVNNELLYADYRCSFLLDDGSTPKNFSVVLMASTDNGKTFQRRSTIASDPTGKDALSESALSATSDGKLVCVIRRTDHEQKPMVITFSKDQGKTWTALEDFCDYGVWPRLLLLDCGVLVLAYGRPGVVLRFCLDGKGRNWTKPCTLKKGVPGKTNAATCGYTFLHKLDPASFLIAYSDFDYKDQNNRQRKALKVQKISIRQ